MKATNKGLRLFLQYGGLILLLAVFNFYNYFKSGRGLSLTVALVCLAGLTGWILFYVLYVRKKPDE